MHGFEREKRGDYAPFGVGLADTIGVRSWFESKLEKSLLSKSLEGLVLEKSL